MENQKGLPSTNEFAVGSTVFGKYEILSFIASGGNGRVYKALDTLRSVEVALKVLLLESFDDKQLIRFQTEAQTASKLRHLNIATVFDFGLADGVPYLVMEYVEGLTLEQMLPDEQRLDLPDFLEIFIQIIEAVNHAHNNGVIHRDIKPGNIVVREDPGGMLTAKILDFGVAKIINENSESARPTGKQTPTGNIVGSPLYMSPEQARGLRVTPKSDYYSIGSLMFRCLSGHPPIQGDTAIETIMRVASVMAPALKEQSDIEAPDQLCELVDALLSKDPDMRPSLHEVVLPVLMGLKEPVIEVSETHTESTARNTTPLMTKVQHLPLIAKVLILGGVLLCGWFSLHTIVSLPEAGKNEPISLNLTATDFSNAGSTTKEPTADIPQTPKATTSLTGPEVLADNTNIDDHELELIENPDDVRIIRAKADHIKTLATIGRFKNLEELYLSSTDIDDQALPQLTKLKKLKRLELRNTDISDAGMDSIAKLTRLGVLDLSMTPNVTSIGIRKLSSLVKLHALVLRDSMFTRSDIEVFAPSINPEASVDLTDNPKISDADRAYLCRRFPDLRFSSEKTITKKMLEDLSPLLHKPEMTQAQVQRLIQDFQEIIDLLEKSYGKDTARARLYYKLIANAYGFKHDPKVYPRRIDLYQKVIKLNQQLGDQVGELEAMDMMTSCVLENRSYAEGKPVAMRAIKLAETIDEAEKNVEVQSRRFSSLAFFATEANQMLDAERFYKRAISILESGKKDSPALGVLTGSLGDCYLRLKNFAKAEACYKRVNQIFKEQEPTREGERNADLMAYGHRAYMLMQQGRLEDALPMHEEFYRLALKPGTALMYAESAVDQRIDLFNQLKRPRSEIDAASAVRDKVIAKKNKHQTRI